MAAHDLQQRHDVADDLAEARAYLAERGVLPTSSGQYTELDIPAIEAAIRSREWIPRLKREEDEWVVEIEDQRDPDPSPIEVTIDPDRITALLRTLALALTWMTTEEANALFNQEARQMMNMSGQEFQEQWEAGKLENDDPRVIHLMMLLRSIGR